MSITHKNIENLLAAMRNVDASDAKRHETDCLRGNIGPIAPYAEAIARNTVLFHAVELRRAEIERSGFNGEAPDDEYDALSRRDDAERAEVYGQPGIVGDPMDHAVTREEIVRLLRHLLVHDRSPGEIKHELITLLETGAFR